MNNLYTKEKYLEIKFCPQHPSIFGILSNRDIQIFRIESQFDFQDEPVLSLVQIVEISQVTTFEWQKQVMAQQKPTLHTLLILAAHKNGKVSLINVQLNLS